MTFSLTLSKASPSPSNCSFVILPVTFKLLSILDACSKSLSVSASLMPSIEGSIASISLANLSDSSLYFFKNSMASSPFPSIPRRLSTNAVIPAKAPPDFPCFSPISITALASLRASESHLEPPSASPVKPFPNSVLKSFHAEARVAISCPVVLLVFPRSSSISVSSLAILATAADISATVALSLPTLPMASFRRTRVIPKLSRISGDLRPIPKTIELTK